MPSTYNADYIAYLKGLVFIVVSKQPNPSYWAYAEDYMVKMLAHQQAKALPVVRQDLENVRAGKFPGEDNTNPLIQCAIQTNAELAA